MSLLSTMTPMRVKSYLHAQRMKAKEGDELRCLPTLCDPQRDALDVGANGGNYTYFMLKHARFVHAFEPIGALAEHLRRRFPARVAVHHMALSSRAGEAELAIPVVADRPLMGLASLDFAGGDGNERFMQETVPLRRLDDVFDGEAGFIKIDVEGHEGEVLDGARATLARCRPTMLIEATERQYPGSVERLRHRLGTLGYQGWFVADDRLQPLAELPPLTDGIVNTSLAELADERHLATHAKYICNFLCLPQERSIALAAQLNRALGR